MGPRCPPLPGCLGPPGPVCSWLHLVPPVLRSLLSRILDKSGDHRSRQDPPGEVSKAQTAGARQPCRGLLGGVSPTTSPSASQTPLLKLPPSLAATAAPGPPAPTCSAHAHHSPGASQPPELFLPLDRLSPQPLASPAPPPCPTLRLSQPPLHPSPRLHSDSSSLGPSGAPTEPIHTLPLGSFSCPSHLRPWCPRFGPVLAAGGCQSLERLPITPHRVGPRHWLHSGETQAYTHP